MQVVVCEPCSNQKAKKQKQNNNQPNKQKTIVETQKIVRKKSHYNTIVNHQIIRKKSQRKVKGT